MADEVCAVTVSIKITEKYTFKLEVLVNQKNHKFLGDRK
jgi:hypothetical protein